MDVLLVAVTLQLVAGIAAFIFSKSPKAATVLGAGGAALGCLIGLVPTWRVLVGGAPESLCLTWDASHGAFCVGLDELSAFFLLPVLGLSALAAVYGGNYLLGYRHQKRLGSPWFFFNVFVAGMVIGRDCADGLSVPDRMGSDVARGLLPRHLRAREGRGSTGRLDLSHRDASRRGVFCCLHSCSCPAGGKLGIRGISLDACLERWRGERPLRARPQLASEPRPGLFLSTSGCRKHIRRPRRTSPP